MRLGLPWRSDASSPSPVERARFEQTSIALGHVLARLEDAPRPGVLDLGGPVASNVELYAQHRARITFADFYRFYYPRENADARRIADVLPAAANHVDIILAWDLLNYLDVDEIGWLGESVSETCAPGAVLLALVACTGSMPEAPSHHTIVDQETIHVDASGASTKPSPAYSEQTLLRSLPGWTVKSRFQLRNSFVEYLFAWE